MDQTLYWTQIGAIGQIAGSVATLAAVIVSLWIVHSERKENIRLTVGERLIIPGDINGPITMIAFSVVNMGLNPVRINSFGWEVGWLQRGPKNLKKRYAIQTGGGGKPGKDPPFDVNPGHSETFFVSGTHFYDNIKKIIFSHIGTFGIFIQFSRESVDQSIPQEARALLYLLKHRCGTKLGD